MPFCPDTEAAIEAAPATDPIRDASSAMTWIESAMMAG